uniref:Carbohydrate kinase PfkB domain-containing protein n=1 Tax=Chrysotila carterae TaxID=13221 RepID=A0A7S4FAN7_CHRCT
MATWSDEASTEEQWSRVLKAAAGEASGPPSFLSFGEALLTYKPALMKEEDNTLMAPSARHCLQSIGGSELNTALALARIGVFASWVSLLPTGPIGAEVLDVAKASGVDVAAVQRMDGDIGTLHVVTDETGPHPHYQRLNSVFCKHVVAGTFAWDSLLQGREWLHMTGITPMLGAGPRDAWEAGIREAARNGLCVSVDLNHRPALGSFEELWEVIKRHLPSLALLMVSERDAERLLPLCGLPAAESIEAALSALRRHCGLPLVACCVKRARDADAAQTTSTLKAGGNRRWSVVAFDDGIASTELIPVEHAPLDPLGGGDAWMAGFVSSALEADISTKISPLGKAEGTADLSECLRLACRRGDLMAALSQNFYGDLTGVTAAQLRELEQSYSGKLAMLSPQTPSAQAGAQRMAPMGAQAKAGDAPPEASQLAASPSSAAVEAALGSARIVPIVSFDDPDHAVPVCRALHESGFPAVEVVLRTPASEQALSRVCAALPSLLVGAGTVLSVAQAAAAVAAGAAFIVSPGLNAAVVRWCQDKGVPIFAGVATATEIEAALGLGLRTLKFFPAEVNGGVKALKALSAPYHMVRWMPTGGVSLDNARSYLALPPVMAVGGSWLTPSDAVKSGDLSRIRALATEALALAARE